ncbi:MAG: hypothetical protein P4L50_11860, partial [Anaerolineaceae bacterium]|nr:hypothetical protein [Anaerolineaceae bacterium]
GQQTMLGEVTGTTGANTVTNAAVIGKVLTGFASTTGAINAFDSILAFANKTTGNLSALTTVVGAPSNLNMSSQIVKRDGGGNFTAGTITASLNGNALTVTTNANMNGEVMSIGNTTTVTNAAVIGKVLTGFTSTTGTITASDSILSAVQKLYGNSTGPLTCTTLTASGAATLNGGLNVTSGKFCVSANGGFSAPTAQGSYISWNRTGSLGMTSFMNQQGGGTGGFEWLNYNNSNVLSPSTPVMTLDSQSNLSLPGLYTRLGGTSITVPTSTTSNNCVQFLQLNAGNGAFAVEISVVVSSNSFSESAIYTVPIQFGATGG